MTYCEHFISPLYVYSIQIAIRCLSADGFSNPFIPLCHTMMLMLPMDFSLNFYVLVHWLCYRDLTHLKIGIFSTTASRIARLLDMFRRIP